MAFELRITNAGRAALADGANRGTSAIRLTKMAIGDGQGPGGAADDGRAVLRNQRAVVALAGTTMVSGRIAVRGEFLPQAAYGVTELGLLGQVGQGAEGLYAYWTDNGERLASTVSGTRLVIAGSLDIQPAAAEVTINVSPNVSLSDPTLSAAVTAVSGRVDAIEAADFPAALLAAMAARTALGNRITAIEDADFGALITALAERVTTLEAGGDSVIRSIQRGSASGSSVSLIAVDPAKTVVNLLSSIARSQYAHASRYAWRHEGAGASQTFVSPEARTISPVGRETLSLSLTSGTELSITGAAGRTVSYEVIEYV